jgi:cell division inhibitor SepF
VPAARNGSGGAGRAPLTRGALAVEPLAAAPPRVQEPLTESNRATAAAAKEAPLSRITTVHPRSYNEARTIGERYREGIPVIMNLTELDDAAAKRLVDFAAGLAFALRGSIDKVTSRVFLLSPTGVDVSAEERRKLAERGFFGQD